MRRVLWGGFLLLLVWVGSFFFWPRSLPVTPFQFELNSGYGLRAVAQQLVRQGFLTEPWTFVWVGRLLGQQSHLKAGSYQWSESLTPWQMLRQMTLGEGDAYEVRIIEGTTFAQLRELLQQQTTLHHDSADVDDNQILSHLGEAPAAPEGWFYPDTYFYNPGDSDWDILQRAHRAMRSHLQALWQQRQADPAVPTSYDALILASLIEKETANPAERPHIAAVFLNRLHLGMRLQTDPTVIYGLGKAYDGVLHRHDLHQDSPFNTYTRSGFPPTPIALPGKAALQAALHPDQAPDLYFVARGDGTHQFSTTLEAHNRAVAHFQLKRTEDLHAR